MDNKARDDIQELIDTMPYNWLEAIINNFQKIESSVLMNEIISKLESLNASWKSEQVENMICELYGIVWQKHHESGKKKLTKLIFPIENYREIYKDQVQNNKKARAKWNTSLLDN